MKRFVCATAFLLLPVFGLLGASVTCSAETWVIVQGWSNPGPDISFTFEDQSLNLSSTTSTVDYGYYVGHWTLWMTSGWAACYHDDGNGVLSPDRFAAFVDDLDGNGHIAWSADTPMGYTTDLLLGYNNSMLLHGYFDQMDRGEPWSSDTYPQHTFVATYIPEPSSLFALLCGISGLGGLMWRQRR